MTETLRASAEYGADALIVCDNLVRIYQVENIEVQALQGLDLLVNKGEMIAIVGQSGSGKSTLLNVLSGLDVPTAGAARVAGWDLLRMSHADRLTYRRSVVGFVWQQTARNLLPYLTAKENVMLPMAFSGIGGGKRNRRAVELLEAMGMADKAGRRPHQLSGGEQQRVAIATALANSPEVIFADEPTGELDSATGDDVFEALRSANRDLGATVVVVTHDHAVSSQVQRTVAIRDGRTATEVVRRTQIGADGQAETLHEEYAVLDRAGRLQIPQDYRQALGLKDRVRLDVEADHLGVWPDGAPRKPRPAPVAEVPREVAVPVEVVEAVGSFAPVEAVDPAVPVAPFAPVAPVVPVASSPQEVTAPVVESPSKPPMPTPYAGVPRPTFAEVSPRPDLTPALAAVEQEQVSPYLPVFTPRSAPDPEDVRPASQAAPAPAPVPAPEPQQFTAPGPAPLPEPQQFTAPEAEPEPDSQQFTAPEAEPEPDSQQFTAPPRMPWLPQGGSHD